MTDDTLLHIRTGIQIAQETTNAIRAIQATHHTHQSKLSQKARKSDIDSDVIYQALRELSEPLANSYAQAISDIHDPKRQSWAGTAHEIRETLRGILEILAPDSKVKSQSGWQLEKGTNGPTQKQKVLYILRQRKAGSKEEEVVRQVDAVEERVGTLVRAIYSRASNAAHSSKDRLEVTRILRYFEAFAHDLLDLE